MTPQEREQKLTEAYLLFGQSKMAEAGLLIKEVLEQDKQDPLALHLLGQISQQQGNYDIARDLYREALKIDPGHANVWGHLGSVLNDLRDAEGAEEALNKALELNPKLARAYKSLADIYLNQGDKKKGIAYLEQALEANPDYLGTYLKYCLAVKPPPDHPVVQTILDKLARDKDGRRTGSILHYALSYVY
ncbi:MAG: tetratricopeptide repeat protein, partial [Proteobacteria bacterium]|nr:tetratricopeptide repeat protein [Pseudomonadota bacterium]